MKIIILAAGRGSRLGEKTKDKPKCMCTLFGKTLFERAMASIQAAGFDLKDIGVVTGYKKEMFTLQGVTYFNNDDWENTNMFISLTKAAEWLKSEPCIVCYSDIIFSPNTLRQLVSCNYLTAITYYTKYWELWEKRLDNPLEDLETFKIHNGYLTEIGKSPKSRKEIQGQYMGLIKFNPKSWSDVEEIIKKPLPKSVDKLDMTTLLNAMIAYGCEIAAIPTDDLWLECDTEKDIATYEEFYKKELMATIE